MCVSAKSVHSLSCVNAGVLWRETTDKMKSLDHQELFYCRCCPWFAFLQRGVQSYLQRMLLFHKTYYLATSVALFRSTSAFTTTLPQVPRKHSYRTTTQIMESFKRAKLEDTQSTKVIGTHSGTFQADEAMGVWMLRQCGVYRNSKVVRSRDPKVLETLDIVIDVGGVYDHSALRYDHHQRDYDERFDSGKKDKEGGRCTKLSASGLVYRHYGKDVIKAYYPALSDEHLELTYSKLYNSLLEALDAIDTGVEPVADGVEMLYKDSTGLSSRVGRLNPRWNEVDSNGDSPGSDERFEKASALCGEDFLAVLTRIVESDIPARSFVEKSLMARHETDPSGEIIRFESGGLPWRYVRRISISQPINCRVTSKSQENCLLQI